ncbi:MAG: hypothetical protein EAZ89_17435 [Bacteroidetes bacterium]|nr:MAG: hypothetical protein EAZ89_17435 [Bacteroidota bacterium]
MTTLTETKVELQTPLQRFYHWEKTQADKLFLSQPLSGASRNWSYGEAGNEARRMASALRERGYEPGTKIAILSKNCAHWIMSDIAVMMGGFVSVPIYPNVNVETVRYVLEHSESKVIFVGKLEDHDWAEMKKGIPADVEMISFGIYDLAGTSGIATWDKIIADVKPMQESPTRDLDDMMTIIYTSGTTGVPKGVVHTFRALAFAATNYVRICGISTADRLFSYLPLSHIAERMLITMGSMYGGTSVNFAHTLESFSENLKEASPTIFLGVPRIWTKFQMGVLAKFNQSRLNLLLSIPLIGGVIRKKIREALGLKDARICVSGAAPISLTLLHWYNKLGIVIFDMYSMTENAAYSHGNWPGNFKLGTVRALPGVEVKITEEGEVCTKSPANMVGYYKEPEKTAETLRDGWLHTGDKGVISPEGTMRVTGRVKDIFKTTKGKYVAPNPIEMKISTNAFVEQICVVGGNIAQPIALVVLSAEARNRDKNEVVGSLTETLDAVNPSLEDHERLQKVVIVREEWTVENGLLTPTLKIKRGAVDDKYMRNYEKWYSGAVGVVWEA